VSHGPLARGEARLAWLLLAPALTTLAVVAVVPLAATAWESLHLYDLRMPWRGYPFVGLTHYREAAADRRLLESLAHTFAFTGVTVALEMVLGLALALSIDAARRAQAFARVVVVLPWALRTVVAALVWRFLFDSQSGIVNELDVLGSDREWLAGPLTAWVPIGLGDVWKSTPFVALLLLAGLEGIDGRLYEAARLDGAGPWQRLRHITLPLLRPALVVALVFRLLDAFRVFDFVYVLTGGGPGTATEVVSLYVFTTLLQDLRFGYGSALSMLVFAITFMTALLYLRVLQPAGRGGEDDV
jgi:multiple sugar transport system permease protein